MKRSSKLFCILTILVCVLHSRAGFAAPEKRLALVIGNAAYKAQPLPTTINDAALISQTLQSAGFDVIGARDLDQNLLREAFRNLTNKIASAGPSAVVFIYFAGYGAQLAGENYLIPVGVEISDVADLPTRAVSLSELKQALSGINSKSTFIVLDVGRPGPFVMAKQAGGPAWTEPESNMLIALSTAPGTLARDTSGSYGAYARAVAEMIREGDLGPAMLFDRVRLRVHELTGGGQIPWDASKIEAPFKFLERTSTVAAGTDASERAARFRLQPMRALGVQNAYATALMRDTFDAYTDFLADYWQDPMTKRVRALLAARRESITWERTCQTNESAAYWSYLERYPSGPHAADAVRSLARMGATTMPPPKFARIDYDIPPPLPDELEYIERPMLILSDPALGFEPPPAISADFLGPPPQELMNLKSSPVSAAHDLPVVNLPLQAFLRVPAGAKVSPNSTSESREAWSMRPAIGVPAGPQKQADSAPVSSIREPSVQNDVAKTERPSSPTSDGVIQKRNPSLQGADREPANGSTSRFAELENGAGHKAETSVTDSTRQTTHTMPRWLADTVVTMRNAGISLKPFIIGSDVTSGPSIYSPASAGLAFQTWRNGTGSDRTTTQSPAAQTSPSRGRGSIPRPNPPVAVSAPSASRIQAKPHTGQLETPSTPTDQAKPRKKPPMVRLSPSTQPPRNPEQQETALPSPR